MGRDLTSRTFIPLLPEPWNAAVLERLLSALGVGAGVPTRCLRPPLTGLPFLTATGQIGALIDEWWRANVPPDSLPVLLMLHDPELPAWIGELEAAFVIGLTDQSDLALYRDADPASVAVVQGGPLEVTEHAIRLYGGERRAEAGPTPGPAPEPDRLDDGPGPAAGQELDPFKALVAARPVAAPAPRPGPRADWQAPHARPLPPGGPAPPWRRPAAPPPPSRGVRAGSRRLGLRAFLRDVLGLSRRSAIPEELTRLALAQTEGKIVGVISRAGGVGKTATAAALGIIFGEAVQHSGWSAAVIDQNTGNPDQWGRLDLDEHVPTVSEIMANIEAGRKWTIPTWGRTPALAVYPENRLAGDAYAPAQIERLARELRRLHALSVIDLPNRLPAFTSGEAALSAGWICAVDLLTIPTTDDPMRLQGVVDLLDAPLIRGDARSGYRSVPVVVAYLRSPMRAIRQSTAVSGVLDQIRERVLDVVEIPKDERATLAIVKGKPITEIDPRLRSAYIDLALAIASALAEA